MSVASSHGGINYPPQVQEMEMTRHSQVKVAEEMEAVKRENEELKEVLSAVQLDLEAKTEVRERKEGSREEGDKKHLLCSCSVGGPASCNRGTGSAAAPERR